MTFVALVVQMPFLLQGRYKGQEMQTRVTSCFKTLCYQSCGLEDMGSLAKKKWKTTKQFEKNILKVTLSWCMTWDISTYWVKF